MVCRLNIVTYSCPTRTTAPHDSAWRGARRDTRHQFLEVLAKRRPGRDLSDGLAEVRTFTGGAKIAAQAPHVHPASQNHRRVVHADGRAPAIAVGDGNHVPARDAQ